MAVPARHRGPARAEGERAMMDDSSPHIPEEFLFARFQISDREQLHRLGLFLLGHAIAALYRSDATKNEDSAASPV